MDQHDIIGYFVIFFGCYSLGIEACGSTMKTATQITLRYRGQMAIVSYTGTAVDRPRTCYWQIVVASGRKIGWRFDDNFNTATNTTKCEEDDDYMELYNCNCRHNLPNIHQRIGKYCGSRPPTPGITPNSYLSIKLVTHGGRSNQGFRVAVQEGKVPVLLPAKTSSFMSVSTMIIAAFLGNGVFVTLICCYFIRRGKRLGSSWVKKFRSRNDPPPYSSAYNERETSPTPVTGDAPPAYVPPVAPEKPPPYTPEDVPPPYELEQHI